MAVKWPGKFICAQMNFSQGLLIRTVVIWVEMGCHFKKVDPQENRFGKHWSMTSSSQSLTVWAGEVRLLKTSRVSFLETKRQKLNRWKSSGERRSLWWSSLCLTHFTSHTVIWWSSITLCLLGYKTNMLQYTVSTAPIISSWLCSQSGAFQFSVVERTWSSVNIV